MLKPLASPTRMVMDLSGTFRARWGDGAPSEEILLGRGYEHTLAVPAAWNYQHPELYRYTGRVWYAKDFYLPSEAARRRVVLRVEAANHSAQVFVNGASAGEHSGSSQPFEVDLTPHVQYAEPNVLVLGVDMDEPRGTRAGDPGPFPVGGLVRPVRLMLLPERRITGLSWSAAFDGAAAVLDYRVEHTGGEVRVELDGDVANGEEGIMRVASARLWFPESASLYPLTVRLYDESGGLLDEYTEPVGFRTLAVGRMGLLVNNKAVYLRGAARYDDFPVTGSGQIDALLVKDLALMRLAGLNVLRPGAHPPSWELARLCDETGMLLMVECVSDAGGPATGSQASVGDLNAVKRSIDETVAALRNHPSIVAWTITPGREFGGSEGGRCLRDLYCHLKDLDPTRPVLCCGDGATGTVDGISDMAVLSLPDTPSLRGEDVGDAQVRLYERIEETCEWSGRPVLVDGFGADGETPHEGAAGSTRSDTMAAYHEVCEANEHVCGTMYRCFADFLTGEDHGRACFNRQGIFTRDRQPKAVAWGLHKRYRTGRESPGTFPQFGTRCEMPGS